MNREIIQKKWILLSFLSAVAILWGSCSDDIAFADSTRTLHETYTSADPGETMEFPEERDFSGWIGTLQQVDYEILKEEPVTERKIDVITVNLPQSRNLPEAADTMEHNGRVYHLKEIITENAPITGRTAVVTQRAEYLGYMEEPEVKEQRTAEYYDEETGQKLEVTVPLQEIKKMDSYWRNDVAFTLSIEDMTADYYELGGERISPGTLPEECHYPAIMAILGLDPESYRIRSLEWYGEDENLIYGRAERYAADYLAMYETVIDLPDLDAFMGTAVYETEWEEETGEVIYTIQAAALYREARNVPIVPTLAGGAVTTGGIIAVVVLYRRRKRGTVKGDS